MGPGPLDVPVPQVVAAVAVAVLAAVAAAWVPAWQASRVDVVGALAGRRGQVRSRAGWPALGVAAMLAGAAVALVLGRSAGGEYRVVAGMALMVGGVVAAMPALVGMLGRVAGRLPVPLRLATRDAARNRGRTAPAAAAVMAAVAGLTALAIGGSSDFAQRRAGYQPRLQPGATVVDPASASGGDVLADPAVWRALGDATARVLPDHRLARSGQVGAVPPAAGGSAAYSDVYLVPSGCPDVPTSTPDNPAALPDGCQDLAVHLAGHPTASGSAVPGGDGAALAPAPPAAPAAWTGPVIADPDTIEALGYRLDAAQRAALVAGRVLVPGPDYLRPDGTAVLTTWVIGPQDPAGGQAPGGQAPGGQASGEVQQASAGVLGAVRRHVLPAMLAPNRATGSGVVAVALLTPATATSAGIGWTPTQAVLLGPALSVSEQDDWSTALAAIDPDLQVYTERGFVDSFGLPLLALALAGTLAVLIGTFTATGLALADGRPDLATLAAIGAPPRTRRAIAAGQALVIGLLGAVTGVLAGFVPGLAVTWPLTARQLDTGGYGPPTIDVPWLLLAGLALAVPLLGAVGAATATRSRLPLSRRLAD